MPSREYAISADPAVPLPHRSPKLHLASSDVAGSRSPPRTQAMDKLFSHSENGVADPLDAGKGFEQVLDETLNILRAELVMAHHHALQPISFDSFEDCFPVPALPDDVSQMKSTMSAGQSCLEHDAVDKELDVLDNWANLYEGLSELHRRSMSAGSALAKETTIEWLLHSVWMTPAESRSRRTRNAVNRMSAIVDLEEFMRYERSGEMKAGDHVIDKLVVHPDGFVRYFWAIIGTIILIYDGITIPMEFVGLLDRAPSSVALGCFVYWVFDLPFQMMTGFHTNGVVEMRFVRTLQRYLHTWCAIDATILILDTFFLIVNHIEYLNAGRSMKLLRQVRVLRIARVGRLHRIGELLTQMSTRIFSEYNAMLVKIARLIILLVAVNHYIACMWYGLGTAGEEDETWLSEFPTDEKLYLYALSLHWSLTQFSPATNNISPKNFGERLFAISVVMFALVYFSSFISSVTNAVNQLKLYGQDKRQERARIREFFSRRSVSTDLGSQVQCFFDEQYSKVTRPLQEEDISFFSNLPETLRIRMHEEIFLPCLFEHQPFNAFSAVDLSLLTLICHVAMAEKHFIPQEDVFVKHMSAQKVRIVLKGKLEYIMSLGIVHMVTEDAWVSEQALYVYWRHLGKLTAVSPCDFAEINCDQFHMAVARHTGTGFRSFQLFANFFANSMEAAVEEGHQITDIDIGERDLRGIAERCVTFSQNKPLPFEGMNGDAAHGRKPWSLRSKMSSYISGA